MKAEAPRRWPWPWRRSIGAWLTLLYTVAAALSVALFAAIADWRLAANFSAEQLRLAQAKLAELQADLADAGGDPQALVDEIVRETAGSRLRQYQARVQVDGRTLGGTPGMAATLPSAVFPPLAGSAPAAALPMHEGGGRRYALAAVRLQGPGPGPAPVVQLALDVTRDAELQSHLRAALALSFAVLVPLLALTGRWMAGQGLAPLARITAAARSITPAGLSARLPLTPPWPEELRELVQVFNAMLAQLDEAFARLGRFSADLAHELRTPLSHLSAELEVCLMRPREAGEYRAALESGLGECRRLNGLIENLLFLARAEHAGQALRREPFDAAQAGAWALQQQGPAAALRGVRTRLEGAATLVADPLLVRQALANLLGNAIRHSRPGGEVRLQLRAQAGAVTIAVQDDGEGIAAAHLPHLFDRFYQVDAARRHGEGQGTGLGLSIVKTIAELHGAQVQVASAPGQGTTMTMVFPQPAPGPPCGPP
ncbi:MAG: heavy metal sensor histidine kinase [Burkholderiales bacterium]|nr:heavy metal sensor histidine kinase [Burkholderiales bacterium]MDE2565695.1 heavy metal sensor histidine kinase [Burkholderiales bacterium]